jgi:hypothetical protein
LCLCGQRESAYLEKMIWNLGDQSFSA